MIETHHHFSRIAYKYRNLRTTDLEPVLFIKKELQNLTKIVAVDVGCGGGRYDKREFGEELKRFQESIARDFKNLNRITWNDENIMLNIRKNVL